MCMYVCERGRGGGGGGGGGQKGCHTYPSTVIPYLKKVKKIHESCDTPLDFC